MFFLSLLAPADALAGGGGTELQALKQRVAELEQLVKARSVSAHHLPKEVMLLGQRFPLELDDVRRRMEREFYVALDDRATLVLWQKRAGAVFPVIERALRKAGAPDDLKYVAVIESGLKPRARSYAGAVGPWQFMPATARDYGLKLSKGVDHRRDLEESTEAAVRYLKRLYKRFDCWFLALAAYNAGQGRVSRSMKSQGVKSYWDVSLPNEAERYVSRVAAAKLILSNPARFGVEVPQDQRYSEGDFRRIKVSTSQELAVVDLARAAKTTYRHLRQLNPWITAGSLPAGAHAFDVPSSGAAGFDKRVAAINSAARKRNKAAMRPKAKPRSKTRSKARAKAKSKRSKKAKVVRHRVRSGESLWDVAVRYGVTVAELSKRNRLRRPDMIHPGQMLRVR